MSIEGILSRITLQRFSVFIFVLILIGYGTFEAYDLWIGPNIVITSPLDGSLVSESLVTIEGKTRNVSWISMLGRPISVDEQGNFKEKLLLPAGYSILTFEAKDRLGRKVHEKLTLVRPWKDEPVIESQLDTSTTTIPTVATSTEEILIIEP